MYTQRRLFDAERHSGELREVEAEIRRLEDALMAAKLKSGWLLRDALRCAVDGMARKDGLIFVQTVESRSGVHKSAVHERTLVAALFATLDGRVDEARIGTYCATRGNGTARPRSWRELVKAATWLADHTPGIERRRIGRAK